jgi:hypothetical protein
VRTEQLFVHRDKADGTIASFCRGCFMTVASSHWEAELERAENNHKCDPIQLAYLDAVLNQISESDSHVTETSMLIRGRSSLKIITKQT